MSPHDRKLADQLRGEEGRLDVDELRTGVRARARSWVGVVRFESFEVRISPKLAGDNLGLVEMLVFSAGMDALRRNIGMRSLDLGEEGELFELLVLLLVEACDRIIAAGLLQDYLEFEGDLPFIRGRLLPDRQLRRRMGGLDRLECRYDDRSSDIPENQILTAALGICRSRVRHPIVSLRARRTHAILAATCSTEEFNLKAIRDTLSYNRLNEHYREAHELAWLVFDGLGIHDLMAVGSTRCFAFLLDMNRLFELFVKRLVAEILRGRPYRLRYQRPDRSILWDSTHGRPYSKVVPDLLLETAPASSRRLAIDAKYKTYDERRFSSADIYQSFLYAYAFNSKEAKIPKAILLYPSTGRISSPVRLEVRSLAQRTGARIETLGIHIPSALEEVSSHQPGPVTELLLEVIQQDLVGM